MLTRRAFTLVELLVVITIIVILVAMITPALSSAIHAATVAVCGANMKGNLVGASQYAFDHKRRYFRREAVHTANLMPRLLARPYSSPLAPDFDDRPTLMPYIAMDALADPFFGGYDLEPDPSDANTLTHASYNMWWGFGFTLLDGAAVAQGRDATFPRGGMFKIGDRMGWHEYKFDLLITDILRPDNGANPLNVVSSHPPRDGHGDIHQRQDAGLAGVVGVYTLFNFDTRTQNHDALDQNTGWQDGSVRRYDAYGDPFIYADAVARAKGDYRMRPVPWVNNAGYEAPFTPMGTYYMIPPAN